MTSERDPRQDVADVLVRYATAIDQKDWVLFRTCFTDDCHADYGDIGVWDGVAAIADTMSRIHPAKVRTLHRITNAAVSREGDGAVARSYVDVLFVLENGGGVRAAGTYDDALVHTADGWRIARRRFTRVHQAPLGGGA
jgi:3-phenylpropionate/cinnamic acid dioxygenase small subunit